MGGRVGILGAGFLLDGFSAGLGARPLKRAIDQYLLAPLAATIVDIVSRGRQFLFVRSDGKAIKSSSSIRMQNPRHPFRRCRQSPHACGLRSTGIEALASAVLQPTGLRAEREQLLGHAARASKRNSPARNGKCCAMNSAAQMSDGRILGPRRSPAPARAISHSWIA